MKKALITGITGQDGSYLAELLLSKGYEVHGIKRRSSSFNTQRLEHLYQDPHLPNRNFFLHHGDITDANGMLNLISTIKPDEIYNLAAQSHVGVSFDVPSYTASVDALGTLNILEATRILGITTRIYQASTSELFGLVQETPQRETTPFYPRSPYGVAKLYGYWISVNYREAYGMHVSNGILFNHTSPRRGETFVCRKTTMGVAAIAQGRQKKLYLGNLDASRDWGHAKDYVRAMWMMLQQEVPDDFVIATGKTIKVRDFVRKSFLQIGVELEFTGSGVDEKGIVVSSLVPSIKKGDILVEVDPQYYRPSEVDLLLGDPSKAKSILGWEPEIPIDDIIREMVQSDTNV